MKKPCRILAALAAGALIVSASASYGYDLPAVNLGFTSFLDGIPPAGPGLYFAQYVQYYTADAFMGGTGSKLPLPNPDLEAWISLTQLIYQWDTPVCGAQPGLDIILPYADIDAEYGADGPFPRANSGGFGDLLVGPYLQWVKMGPNGPRYAHRIEAQMLFPTGKYDEDREINPGSNVFSFNPYWAGTLFFGPNCEVSTRIHYLWNAENDDPADSSQARDVQAGQAVHANFAASYGLNQMVRVGVNGYYLQQLTETEVDGNDVDNSEEQVLGIGPGALVSFSQHTHLFVNAYFESEVENRTEGERYNVRFVHHF
jgi:hypothetical protein